MKKIFKLVGSHIKYSASPFIHNEIFKMCDEPKFSYGLFEVMPSNFENMFKTFNQFDGLNITSPFKIDAFKKLDSLSKYAKTLGCVNTIKKLEDNTLKGYCTDGIGFLKSLNMFNEFFFKRVLILGFGGAGQMAAYSLMDRCSELYIITRNFNILRQNQFKQFCKNIPKTLKVKIVNSNQIKNISFNLIINATPCGNFNNLNMSPINLHLFKQIDNVFDLTYFPLETIFLYEAKKLNCKIMNGVAMLVWQAVESEKIWNNFHFKNSDIELLIKKTTNFLANKKI